MRFVHHASEARVLFGVGRRVEIIAELASLGSRPLIVCDDVAARIAGDVRERLDAIAVAAIDEVRQHVPVEDAEAARALARNHAADCLVALGGGSTIGLAKAIALTEQLPIFAVPTTYAGSEMTPIWGLTDNNLKTTGRCEAVAPRIVLYDPELTYSLPASITAASGLNAVAHCVDALWAAGRTPLTDLMAERGIELLSRGLPPAVRWGNDPDARARALAGAWLAGATFGVAGSSIHHKLCHLLGGRFNLPHAETHAVLLPLVADLAVARVPRAGAPIGRALRSADPVKGLRELAHTLRAPRSLHPFGLGPEAGELADEIDINALGAPFPVEREDIRTILMRATSPAARHDET